MDRHLEPGWYGGAQCDPRLTWRMDQKASLTLLMSQASISCAGRSCLKNKSELGARAMGQQLRASTSFRRPRFHSQHPMTAHNLPVTPVSGDLTSLLISRGTRHTHGATQTHIHADKTHLHIKIFFKENNKNKIWWHTPILALRRLRQEDCCEF